MATKKCYNTECGNYNKDTRNQIVPNQCRTYGDVSRCKKVMLSPVTKYYNKNCFRSEISSGNSCSGYQDMTQCHIAILSSPVQAWAESKAIKIMLVSEAYKAGLLKPGVRIKSNATLNTLRYHYLIGTIISNDEHNITVQRADKKPCSTPWTINTSNARAIIEILENEDKKESGASTYNEDCVKEKRIVIVCNTEEEWHAIKANHSTDWPGEPWVFYPNRKTYSSVSYARKEGYTLTSAKDYLSNLNNKTTEKESKNMRNDREKITALEKQFEEEKNKDFKVIVKHCHGNLDSILLQMLLEEKADKVKAYAMDLETKEIAAAKKDSCKSGE